MFNRCIARLRRVDIERLYVVLRRDGVSCFAVMISRASGSLHKWTSCSALLI